MLCLTCNKKKSCVKLCQQAEEYVNQDYVKRNRNEQLECERSIGNDEIEQIDFPESLIELNLEDWRSFVGAYKMTKIQKRYLFLKYWKYMSLTEIGKRYKRSPATVYLTIRRFLDNVIITKS